MKTCCITSAWYKVMLKSYVISELQQRNIVNNIVWMQDGAFPGRHQHICSTSIATTLWYRTISCNFAVSCLHNFSTSLQWISGSRVTWNQYLNLGVTIKSKKFVRIERCYKTWSCIDFPYAMLHSALLSVISWMQCVIICEGKHVVNC